MKSVFVSCWFFLMGFYSFQTSAQIQVSFPVSRAVFQRNTNNEATIRVNGYFTTPVTRIDARVQARDGQGTSTDWVTIQNNPTGGNYAGDLTVKGGWYNLEVRGMNGDQQVGGSTIVERVGAGEVFVIAGQSNGQGVYDDMPSASDDRINCVNYFDPSESQNDPPMDVLNLFSHVNQGGRITPRGVGSWCWGRVGDMLAQRLNVPIMFFNAGYIGTAVKNWRESAENGRTESIYSQGLYYADGQPYANLRIALQFYINMLGVRAILWQQGEAENFDNTSQGSYYNHLQYVINRSRQDANKNIAWVVARVSYSGDSRGARPQILAAQNQIISSVSNVFPGPETDNIQIPRQRPPRTIFDDVHFDVNGLYEVANVWNNSLNDGFFANAQPISPTPAPTVTVSCAGTNQLSIAVNGSFSSVTWNTGEGGQRITKGAGQYRAKVKDAAGNVLFSPVVRVASAPSIQASGPTTFCAGNSVTLRTDYDNNIQWNNNNTSQQLSVNSSGDYSVQYRDVSGCTFVSGTTSVRVNPLPAIPTVTAQQTTTFCQGGNTTLSANEVAGYRYRWNSGQTDRNITVQTAGAYTVTATDQNGCTSPQSQSIAVVVNPLPATPVIAASGNTTFCADQRVTLTSTENTAYQWTNGATSRAVTINQSGVYTVRTQNQFSCFSAPSNAITIRVNPLPNSPTLTANGPTTFCDGNQVALTATSNLRPLWSTGDSVQTIQVRQSGSYSARVRDNNGCFSPLATAIAVDVKPLPSVPSVTQIGTYTLEAMGSLSGDFYRWYINTDTLAVQTAIIKAGRSGSYAAQAFIRYSPTLTCFSDPSARLNFVVDDSNQGLSIYPNPSPDKIITLETLNNLANATIRIFTVSGREVETIFLPSIEDRKSIDLQKLAPGMYIMQINAINYSASRRFLVGMGN
ncbi:T9SS type A sorting domain-containing protein [Spirosoma sp. RP8]|uniref:T9SS type A sorting domain-containing protein n=1 Tax=Spirosoma liriopis TaxID=2937440 RepID=A0ABT0HE23_9BACT|nr:T9SS type A sorting domain-containing protein [Spirosoma liriopis]MCK8490240.1 T9SS type A sorting domain-containing protein [Spirosoma liriopis]